jgi:PAS domain S-box-containing protein
MNSKKNTGGARTGGKKSAAGKNRAKAGASRAAPKKRPERAEVRRGSGRNAHPADRDWRALVETSAAWIWETGPDLHHTYTNAFVHTCLGYLPAEFLKHSAFELIHPDDHALVNEIVQKARTRGEGWTQQVLRWRHKDGSWRSIESSGIAVLDERGTFAGLRGIDRDVTDLLRADTRLRASETRYRTLFDSMDAAVLLMRGAECVECNPATLKLFGLSRKDEIIGKTPLDFAPPKQPDGRDSAEMVQWNIEQALEKGLHVFEWESRRKSGEPFYMEVRFTPYRIGDEQYFQCIAIDITERKRAEERLKESESRLRTVFENAPDTILQVDREGTITFVNRPVPGLTKEQIIGTSAYQWVPREQHSVVSRALEQVFTTGKRQEYESAGPGPGGEARFYNVRVMPVAGGAEIDSAIYIATDITEQKMADQKVAERQALLQQIMDTANVAIFLVDKTGRITHANRRMANMFGCAMEELVGSEYVAHVHPSERERGRQKMLALLASEIPSVDLERNYWRKDGTEFWGHLVGRRFHDVQETDVGLIGVITDITDRRRAEERLRESESHFRKLFENLSVVALVDGRAIGCAR